MTRSTVIALAALAIGGAAAPAAFAQSSDAAPARSSCFTLQNWRDWTSPDPSTIYIRTVSRDVYRVDLLNNRQPLKMAGRFLVVEPFGSNQICNPVDLNIRLGDISGFATPLFPQKITRLSDAEVAALPKRHRP